MEHSTLEILSIFSHDLKSPVASMQSILAVLDLKKDKLTDAEVAAYHHKLAVRLHSLIQTTDSLYNVLFLQAGQFPLSLEVIEPVGLLQLAAAIVERENTCEFVFSPTDIQTLTAKKLQVMGDKPKLLQALRSLLNFVASVSEKESPQFSVTASSQKVQVTLSFVGQPLPPGEQKKLFQLEYDLEKMKDKKVTPALFVAAEIIKLHRGKVRFSSKNGTSRLVIELPLAV